jgi:serine/threonine-protein kinase SRPK3
MRSVTELEAGRKTWKEDSIGFQQDVKAIDPTHLATAMGGTEEPPEEPLLATLEEGFGYFTTAAVG